MGDDTTEQLKGAIRVDEGQLRSHVDEAVRSSVEQTLNALLEAEADQICRAQRYEHSPERVDTRAGHYERQLGTKAGEVTLKVPKLRRLPFETAIIERYRRRETSVEEALVEMYLAGVSTRRIEDITEALWGTRVSSSTVSELNKKIYGQINDWRNRPIEGEHPYVFLDGIWLKRCWGGEVKNVAVLVTALRHATVPGAVPNNITLLATGVLKSMSASKLKSAAALLLVCGALVIGGGFGLAHLTGQPKDAPDEPGAPKEVP